MPKSADWRFLSLFAGCYVAMYVAYALIPEAFLQQAVFHYGIACPAKALINWIAADEHVAAPQDYLRSAGASLQIVRGCDGAGVLFLLIAAMIAFRARLVATLSGALGAVAIIYTVNELRIVTLFLVLAHHPIWFTWVHVYIIPTLMILVGVIYFSVWTARCQRGAESAAQA